MSIHLYHQGRNLGAFSKEQVETMLKAGIITHGTLAWAPGMAEWQPLIKVIQPDPLQQAPTAVAIGALGGGATNRADKNPKGESSSPTAVPPIIATPSFEVSLSEPIRQEILKSAKVHFGQAIAWTLFLVGINACAQNTIQHPPRANGVAALLTLICGIFVLRSWCKRQTMRVISRRNGLQHIHVRSCWSFQCRSICVALGIAILLSFGGRTPQGQMTIFFFVLFVWLILSLFALDVPFWCRRKVQQIIESQRPNAIVVAQSGRHAENTPLAPVPVRRPWFAIIAFAAIILLLGLGAWFWLAFAAADKQADLQGAATEQKHYLENMTGLMSSGADGQAIKQIQNSHYANLTQMVESSAHLPNDKRLVGAVMPIFDQANQLREKWEDDMQKLKDAGFADPSTLTTLDALKARMELADSWCKDSQEAYSFFLGYSDKLDTSLEAAGVGKPTRDRILADAKSKQSVVDDVEYANLQVANNTQAILEFLNDSYGHWSIENGTLTFDTQDRTDEYNDLFQKYTSWVSRDQELETSAFGVK